VDESVVDLCGRQLLLHSSLSLVIRAGPELAGFPRSRTLQKPGIVGASNGILLADPGPTENSYIIF
jgi:hypothetical protein